MQITTSALGADTSPLQLDWANIDTVLLDMDGTLLDLNYDNHVWNEILPKTLAAARNLPLDRAELMLAEHMREIRGSIEFYSFEYWSAYTGLDLIDLHRTMAHLVAYRPGALEFLRWLKSQDKLVVIATNAHPHSLLVKEEMLPISLEVDAIVSSADLHAPKEDQTYWQKLRELHPFDPDRALFVDDNEPVLDAAACFGIAHLLCIFTPDSERPARIDLTYPAFDHFADLYAPG